MIIKKYIKPIQKLFSETAMREETLSYGKFFSVFGDEELLNADIYDTLEQACRNLINRDKAICEALLAKKDDGLPGDGFFDVYKNNRWDEYKEIADNLITQDLNLNQKREIVLIERKRVYEQFMKI